MQMLFTKLFNIYILSFSCLLDVCYNKPPPTATILPKIYFDPDKDATDINGMMAYRNMRGVAALLAKRTIQERMNINTSYTQLYHRNLKDDVGARTADEFYRLLMALLSPVADYLIEEINWSLDQGKNWEYMSILCTSPGQLLKQMVARYNRTFAWQMRDIFSSKMRQPDGFQFMQSIIDSNPIRPNTIVMKELIESQVALIPESNGYCTQQENPKLFQFMAKSSFAQIAAVANAYNRKTKISAVQQIWDHCWGDLREAYSRIFRYATDPVAYFAAEIRDAKSNDRDLTLAILTRSEIDLAVIKKQFYTTYQITLEKWIEKHAAGDYENTLQIIISGDQF